MKMKKNGKFKMHDIFAPILVATATAMLLVMLVSLAFVKDEEK